MADAIWEQVSTHTGPLTIPKNKLVERSHRGQRGGSQQKAIAIADLPPFGTTVRDIMEKAQATTELQM